MPKYTHMLPMGDRKNPAYRYRELIHALGGSQRVFEVLEAYGYDPPTPAVIRGWVQRNSIPSRWLPLILHRLMSDGVITDIGTLIEGPK